MALPQDAFYLEDALLRDPQLLGLDLAWLIQRQHHQIDLVSKIMRVFYNYLVKLHAMNLAFPLSQQDALRITQPLFKGTSSHAGGAKSGFLSFPELFDLLFARSGGEEGDMEGINSGIAETKQALEWEFWVKL